MSALLPPLLLALAPCSSHFEFGVGEVALKICAVGFLTGTANRVFRKFQVRVFLLVFPDFARSSSSSCFKIGDANIQVRVFSFFRFFKFEFKFFSNNLNFLDSRLAFAFLFSLSLQLLLQSWV